MRTGTVVSTIGLAGVLAFSGYGSRVIAQAGRLQVGGSSSNAGQATLRTHFAPDPYDQPVVSGGAISADTLGYGPGCVGWVTARPDFILHFNGNAANLRFFVTSAVDTTLLVNTARGTWVCNDDSYGGNNPTVNIPNAGAGQYDVWIGSFQNGVQAHGVLHITQADRHP